MERGWRPLFKAPNFYGLDNEVPPRSERLVGKGSARLRPPVVEVAVEAEAKVAVASADVEAFRAAADDVVVHCGPRETLRGTA